jgi:hypothetical protein
MTGAFKFIDVVAEGGVTTITLNRPEALNALVTEMHFELHRAFDAFAAAPEQRVAVIRGAGRAFCAGSDLKATPTVMVPPARKAERYPTSSLPPTGRVSVCRSQRSARWRWAAASIGSHGRSASNRRWA